MPSLVIVFVFPAAKQLLCRVKRGKEMGVQELVSHKPSIAISYSSQISYERAKRTPSVGCCDTAMSRRAGRK